MENKILIFTDGASRGNPGPGGWGAVLASAKEVMEIGGGAENTTNNRMEISAVANALAYVGAFELSGCEINIFTDSSYVLNGATKWIKLWQGRGWKTMDKRDVLNKDLWELLAEKMEGKNIKWQLVSGHVGIVGNERADEIATDFADGKQPKLFRGKLSDYGLDISNINYDELKKAAKSDSKKRSGGKAYSYVSLLDGVIEIHKTWEECERRVKGKPAKFKKALSAEDEKNIIKGWGK